MEKDYIDSIREKDLEIEKALNEKESIVREKDQLVSERIEIHKIYG